MWLYIFTGIKKKKDFLFFYSADQSWSWFFCRRYASFSPIYSLFFVYHLLNLKTASEQKWTHKISQDCFKVGWFLSKLFNISIRNVGFMQSKYPDSPGDLRSCHKNSVAGQFIDYKNHLGDWLLTADVVKFPWSKFKYFSNIRRKIRSCMFEGQFSK